MSFFKGILQNLITQVLFVVIVLGALFLGFTYMKEEIKSEVKEKSALVVEKGRQSASVVKGMAVASIEKGKEKYEAYKQKKAKKKALAQNSNDNVKDCDGEEDNDVAMADSPSEKKITLSAIKEKTLNKYNDIKSKYFKKEEVAEQ